MGYKTQILIPSTLESFTVDGLAESVLRFVALARLTGGDPVQVEALLPVAEQIFLHEEDIPRRALLDAARKDRILADLLMDHVLPGVARRLESGWGDDRLSFVDVTIAATRLQDALRALGRFSLPARDAESILMIVPRWEQHSLPAAFVSDRMRKLGAPTRLVTGLGTAELLRVVAAATPSALMVSTGSYRSLALVPDLIRDLRRGVPRALPVVVGGPALLMAGDDARRAGADLLTNDPCAALRFCDFPLLAQGAPRPDVSVHV